MYSPFSKNWEYIYTLENIFVLLELLQTFTTLLSHKRSLRNSRAATSYKHVFTPLSNHIKVTIPSFGTKKQKQKQVYQVLKSNVRKLK